MNARTTIMTRSWWDDEDNCIHWEIIPEHEWRAPDPEMFSKLFSRQTPYADIVKRLFPEAQA
jgi:hypothetical protein